MPTSRWRDANTASSRRRRSPRACRASSIGSNASTSSKMQLPVKYVPKQSHHLGNVIGAAIIILFGLIFMSSYLPDRAAVESAKMSFGEWLGLTGVRLPFLLVTIAVLLFGLVALAVSLINMLG